VSRVAPSKLRRRGGFTMVEALISLSITAMLMLAMGGAFTAAANSVQNNDEYFRAVQQGRVALDLIMGEVRRCATVASCTATSLTLTPSSDFNGDSLTFTIANGQITMTDNVASTTTVLAANVVTSGANASTFNSLINSSSNYSEIALTLTIWEPLGNNPVTLSNSAAPRYSMGTEWN
jgi:Tfp pilus assembly protein PilW